MKRKLMQLGRSCLIGLVIGVIVTQMFGEPLFLALLGGLGGLIAGVIILANLSWKWLGYPAIMLLVATIAEEMAAKVGCPGYGWFIGVVASVIAMLIYEAQIQKGGRQ